MVQFLWSYQWTLSILFLFSIASLKHPTYYPLSTPLSDNVQKEYAGEQHLKLDKVPQVLL